jgi:hypothetical protein
MMKGYFFVRLPGKLFNVFTGRGTQLDLYFCHEKRSFSILNDSIRSKIKQTIVNYEEQKDNTLSPDANPDDDENIHPDWLALERRVKRRKPQLKSKILSFFTVF